jgi:DoxX-like family
VVLIEAVGEMLSPAAAQNFSKMGLPQSVRVALAGGEVIAAILYMLPRTIAVGGYGLLGILGFAMVLHVWHGQYDVGALFVYAMAVWVSLANRDAPRTELARDRRWIARGVEECRLANSAFPHQDHLKLAFLYLRKYPALEALGRFSTSLIRFATANGRPDFYHETITWGFLLVIRERMARSGNRQVWVEFAAGNPDVFNWKDNIPKEILPGGNARVGTGEEHFSFSGQIRVVSWRQQWEASQVLACFSCGKIVGETPALPRTLRWIGVAAGNSRAPWFGFAEWIIGIAELRTYCQPHRAAAGW